jgi:hypothetical protein
MNRFTLWLAITLFLVNSICWGDSAIPLLSGFDAERVAKVYPPVDEDSTGELAKLLYRLQKVSATTIESGVGESSELGDIVTVAAEIRELANLAVPEKLTEFLEIKRMQVLVCQTNDQPVRIVTINLPEDAKVGDRIEGAGVVIENESGRAIAIATARLRWFPKAAANVGWRLLTEAGLDISLLSDASTRSRRPMLAQDGDAFYSLLAAAATIRERTTVPPPEVMDAVKLLQAPENLSGQWIRMDLETVQITRVAVTEPHRQNQLGSDHYYQIDAMGDLGNVVIRIDPPTADGTAVTFNNRYPVSIVVRELPDFLIKRISEQEAGDAVIANVKNMVGVDAFFYRLWSYSTEFMKQQGGGEQFGPLLVAAEIRDQEPTSSDPAGVFVIGWIVAIAIVCGILATWAWNRQTSLRDREVREKRKLRESEDLQLP